jgi:transposase, IS6 family
MRTRRPHLALLPGSAFAGFCFPPDVIVLWVLVLRLALSDRDVEELLAERGIQVDHVTVYHWVQRFTPYSPSQSRPCRHAVGNRWWVDETSSKVAGQWRHVDRAVDQLGAGHRRIYRSGLDRAYRLRARKPILAASPCGEHSRSGSA